MRQLKILHAQNSFCCDGLLTFVVIISKNDVEMYQRYIIFCHFCNKFASLFLTSPVNEYCIFMYCIVPNKTADWNVVVGGCFIFHGKRSLQCLIIFVNYQVRKAYPKKCPKSAQIYWKSDIQISP